ncbi:MAG: GyrI-like domain-containing protein, partial [Gemmatimonadaceae bacterium]|nr:GyrI-like domain-containing protein [Gemmatimonadaceae bacterium]
MIDTPALVVTTRQPLAMIRLTVAPAELRHVIGPALGELTDVLATQQLRPTGPWLTYHFRRPTATFDCAVCMPVATPIEGRGRVTPGELPAVRVARTVHHGGYEGLRDAWGALAAWITREGHTAAEDLWESYVTGPDSHLPP